MCYCDKFIKNTIVLNEKKMINRSDVFHVAFCFDNNYAMPAGLALMSVIENNQQEKIMFHLFVNELTKENLANFNQLALEFDCSMICYEIDNNFSINSKTLVLGISVATCLRFMVPEILGKITERVLYLDSDILCVGKLHEIFHIDMMSNIAAVVSDTDNMQKTQGAYYGIEYGKYFNAGVIFFNTTLWNKAELTEKTFGLINNGNVYTFADQDVLNIVLKNRTLLLPKDYNCMTALSVNGNEDANVSLNTKIIHYITKNKPWHQPYKTKLFDYYFLKSPWKCDILPLYNDNKTSSIRAYARLMYKQKKYLLFVKHYMIYLKKKLSK